jgi:hypothetical protein
VTFVAVQTDGGVTRLRRSTPIAATPRPSNVRLDGSGTMLHFGGDSVSWDRIVRIPVRKSNHAKLDVVKRSIDEHLVRSGVPDTVAMKITGHKTQAVIDPVRHQQQGRCSRDIGMPSERDGDKSRGHA